MGRKLVVVLLFLCACSIVYANDVNRRRIFNNYFTSKSGSVPALIPNTTAGVFPQVCVSRHSNTTVSEML